MPLYFEIEASNLEEAKEKAKYQEIDFDIYDLNLSYEVYEVEDE